MLTKQLRRQAIDQEEKEIDETIRQLQARKSALSQGQSTYNVKSDPWIASRLTHQQSLHSSYPSVKSDQSGCYSSGRLKGEAAVQVIIEECRKLPCKSADTSYRAYEDEFIFGTFEAQLQRLGFQVSDIIEIWSDSGPGIDERYRIVAF
jgi:hypothetical protein